MRRLLLALVLVCLAVPGSARASEGEKGLSLYLGYGTHTVPEDTTPHGTVLGVDFERGLSDALSFRVSGGAGAYYGDGNATYSGQGVVGLTYLLDVVRYVPYVNVGLGGIAVFGDEGGTEVSPLIEIGGGLDILHSRTFSYGVQVRFETFIEQTSFFTAGARATWRWGFF